ncbi:MAG: saccharopine dehydrogenase [bacterium]|nr:saccharopine dehydrogenase [bacterium]
MDPGSLSPREFDVVVWGATGFTGRLVASHLLERYGAAGDLRWAVGGRSARRLEAVREELGPGANGLSILVGDGGDAAAMDAVARRTKVVCSTAGPFARYGTELVAACARRGTHYCDITAEGQWIRRMVDEHEAAARASGARLVPCCGFDSIPSDLGCFFINEAMRSRTGRPCAEVKLLVRRLRGAISGGTAASLLKLIEDVRDDRDARRMLADPYSLNPDGERSGPDGPDRRGTAWDEDVDSWTAPFVMAAINTRVVRRSNALMNYAYGRDFRYDEAQMTGRGLRGRAVAAGMSGTLGAIVGMAWFRPTRWLLRTFVLPSPGQGPDARRRARGAFDMLLVGRNDTAELRACVQGDRDPGYELTSRMLGESAVCLARDETTPNVGGGFWTPASCFGDRLIERLERNARMTFTIESDG